MCGRTGMSWRRRSTPGSRTGSRGGDDRVCLRRGEGLRSFQGGRETWKTAPWQPAGSRIRLPLKESDIPVAVNPKSADGPSNNPQCGFWDSQFSAAQVKSVEQPWVLEFDIKGLFDNIDHELLLRAVRRHITCRWALLYIERWLRAPMEHEDGMKVERTRGTPQGGVISPILANLFLHYAFDLWMTRT